jgi:hypothetical protein
MIILIADMMPTEQGLADIESGEILNFSSEISHDYIHNEVLAVPILDEDGNPVLDEAGKPKKSYIRRKYGATLLGGAATNYPFITQMNPDGIAGNKKKNFDFSNPIIDPRNITLENCEMMSFSSDLNDDDRKLELANSCIEIVDNEAWNELKGCICVDDCYYDTNDYKAGDAALPDAAFAIVYKFKGKSGKTLTARKLPHHTSEVKSPTENTSLDIPRLKNALSRLNQTDAPASDIKKAGTHLNAHADATYRKTETTKSTAATDKEFSRMDEPQVTFSREDVQKMINDGITSVKAEYAAKLAKVEEENASLRIFANGEAEKAWKLSVDSTVAKFSKLTPAAKETIRRALINNPGVTVKYTDGDGKTTDMKFVDVVDKIVGSVEFVPSTELDHTTETAPPIVDKKNLANDKEYKQTMKDVNLAKFGYKSRIVEQDKAAAAATK